MPGGYNRWQETFGQTCERIGKREVDVRVYATEAHTLGTYKWRSIADDPIHGHPYGRPLSVYVWTTQLEKIQETGKRRFFRFGQLPSPLVGGAHQAFLENPERYLKILRIIERMGQ